MAVQVFTEGELQALRRFPEIGREGAVPVFHVDRGGCGVRRSRSWPGPGGPIGACRGPVHVAVAEGQGTGGGLARGGENRDREAGVPAWDGRARSGLVGAAGGAAVLAQSATELLEAVEILRELNAGGARKLLRLHRGRHRRRTRPARPHRLPATAHPRHPLPTTPAPLGGPARPPKVARPRWRSVRQRGLGLTAGSASAVTRPAASSLSRT